MATRVASESRNGLPHSLPASLIHSNGWLQEGKPCSGEKLLLMFDRWRKLAKAFFNEKKNQFDISKARAWCMPWCVIWLTAACPVLSSSISMHVYLLKTSWPGV